MFEVLEQVPIPAPNSRRDLRAKIRNILGYLGFLLGTMIKVTGICDGRHCELRRRKAKSALGGLSTAPQCEMVELIKSSLGDYPQKRNRQPDGFFRLAD
jgi:hypothetical protein